jgi:hypothetical protein
VVQAGQRVGKYVLGERIARGGMAEVWAGQVEGPAGFVKPLALKFILETFAGDPELERLFVNEARLAAQLQHANLVAVFDFDKLHEGPPGATVERYYIAMERVEGRDLRRVEQAAAQKGRRIPPPLALHIAAEVLKGLRHVHEKRGQEGRCLLGLVHRDVSPHNVLVGFGGEVKLSDFGIAKAMSQNLGTTRAGTVRGKLAYASPEQLRSEPVDHRSDQFSLGVTLWELLAGGRLFDGADEARIIAKVLRCEVPPLPASAGVDPGVEAVVRRMVARTPELRFPTTAAALAAVQGAPGYAADAAPLVELMRDLYAAEAATSPSTLRLDGAAPPVAAAAGARPVAGAGAGGQDARSPPSMSAAETRSMERVSVAPGGARAGGAGGGGDGDGDPLPAPDDAEDPGGHTGSAYAWGSGTWPPSAPARSRARWLVGGLALAAAGALAIAIVTDQVSPFSSPEPAEPGDPPPDSPPAAARHAAAPAGLAPPPPPPTPTPTPSRVEGTEVSPAPRVGAGLESSGAPPSEAPVPPTPPAPAAKGPTGAVGERNVPVAGPGGVSHDARGPPAETGPAPKEPAGGKAPPAATGVGGQQLFKTNGAPVLDE